jgi:hypothetical protein
VLRDFATFLHAVVCLAAATAAGALPRRYWPHLEERLPIARVALVSALTTVAIAGVIALPAFFRHAEASADRAADTMLQSTGWRSPGPGGRAPSDGTALATWLTSYLSFLSFALLTPAGLVSAYLGASGLFRAVAAAVDEPRGDPLLTALDAATRRAWSRHRSREATAARERAEGPEVPDRLVPGAVAGFPDATYVVVASRQKPGWAAGAFVITAEKWYRLGTPVERRMPGGLRTLYPLTELRDHEVLRRGIPYELPALTASFSKME